MKGSVRLSRRRSQRMSRINVSPRSRDGSCKMISDTPIHLIFDYLAPVVQPHLNGGIVLILPYLSLFYGSG